jgi:hypothetical protein
MNTTTNIPGHNAVGGATKRGAPDPSVPVPPGVKAQADRANALIEQAKAAKEANEAAGGNELVRPVVPPARPNPGVITANFDPSNPRPPSEFEIGDPNDTRTQSRTFVPPPPPPPVVPQFQPPAPTPPQPQNEADWEHQFKSLKGRYDRDQENTRRLQQTLLDQQRLLAQVGSPPPNAPQGEGSGVRFNVAPPPPGRRVTPAEVTEYGAELMDVVGRRAAEVYEPIIQQLASELNQVRRQVGGVQNTVVFDARVKMYDDLARAVPNWNAINDSPQFGQWLDQIDPISHRTRREFLNGAHNANQAGQVIDIFNTFLDAVGAARSAGNGAGNGAGNPQGNPPASPQQFDLLQLAAPGRAKSGQTQAPPEKGIVYRSEIKQFYTDKTQGKYAGREAEAAAIERQIFDAGNEGRIR